MRPFFKDMVILHALDAENGKCLLWTKDEKSIPEDYDGFELRDILAEHEKVGIEDFGFLCVPTALLEERDVYIEAIYDDGDTEVLSANADVSRLLDSITGAPFDILVGTVLR